MGRQRVAQGEAGFAAEPWVSVGFAAEPWVSVGFAAQPWVSVGFAAELVGRDRW